MPSLPPWIIASLVALGIGFFILMLVKSAQNAPHLRSVTSTSETAEGVDGWKTVVEARNGRYARRGWIAFILVAVFSCVISLGAPKASIVKAALWPSATPTASNTPTITPTRTLKPTPRITMTPRYSATPSATQTPLVTQTARIIYQPGGQSVVTQIVRVDMVRTVIVPQTVVVVQTVIVTPIVTGTDTAIATASPDTATPTASPSPTATETPTAE